MGKQIRNGVCYGSDESIDIKYNKTNSDGSNSETNVKAELDSLNGNLSNKADKTMLSNRNLLDNPFFTVNSRGKTEYTGEVYTVDRWILQDVSGEAKLVVNSDNSLTITTVNNDGLKQVFNKLELNKTYTISFNDGTKIWTSTFVWEGTDIIKLYDDAVTVNYAIIAQENYDVIYPYVRYSTKANEKIVSVKLELGSVSTLANDVAPNYQEELIKCMTSTADSTDTYANRVPNFAPNPNLLDNPWFTVNQRGQSSYASNGYTVDRWGYTKNSGTSGNVSVNDGYLILDDTNSFYQKMENFENLKGKTITLSADVEIINSSNNSRFGIVCDGYENSWLPNFISLGTDTSRKIYTTTITIPSSGITSIKPWIYLGNGMSVKLYSIKLELGSVSTLANDVAPNYQQELAKCQRYFYKAKLLVVNGFLTANGQGYCMSINLPSCMAKEPTINLESYMVRTATGYSKHTSNSYVTPINLSVAYFNGNNITIRDTITATAVDTNNSVMVFTITDLELSADL